jgi:hypothetical protein
MPTGTLRPQKIYPPFLLCGGSERSVSMPPP